MKRILLCVTVLFFLCTISAQVQKRDPVDRPGDTDRQSAIQRRDEARGASSALAFCGTTIDWVAKVTQEARRALDLHKKNKGDRPRTNRNKLPVKAASPTIITPQPAFPTLQVVTCNKFRLYYEDFLAMPADGFAHPGIGLARRNTFCAALTYAENVYDFSHLPSTEFIDLYVHRSYSSTNPAPTSTGFLATGGPLLPFGFSVTPGFYGGYMFDHLTSSTGADPEPGQYDGTLHVNFDKTYPGAKPAAYWDDYLNTSSTCKFDLYSVLLHEVTHVMGWLSTVKEDASSNHYPQNSWNNSFTLYDKNFLYYGEAKTPSSFAGKKLVTTAPAVNPSVSSVPNAIRSSKIWMNDSGIPLNHPAYSGDFDGYSTVPAPFAPDSLLSHLNDNFNSFTRMSQYSPGFQPSYVMGPSIDKELLKRQWTNFEMRALLTLGYQLNPAFASAMTLSNGVVTNQNLLTINQPPYRTAPAQVTELALWLTQGPAWAETIPVTATIPVNNNTASNPNATSQVVNVSSLGADNGDVVKIFPNSLFNIRGSGSFVPGTGGNNHNQLSVNAAGTQLTYKPRPGFRGRAQFGFYLWDGKEKGSFVVATIEVVSVGSAYVPPTNKIMNGDFELGTEVRQRMINENIEHTGREFYREGPFMSGYHLSDNQPSYNIRSNAHVVNGGEHVYHAWKDCSQVNNGVKGNYGLHLSDFNLNGYTIGPVKPLGNSGTNPNQRYHSLAWDTFMEMSTPVSQCNYYRFGMNINFQRTALVLGSNYPVTLEFISNPGANASAYTTWKSFPLLIPVTTVTPNVWQYFAFDFPYCPSTPATFINLTTGPSSIYPPPLIDNVSLRTISAPPLTVSAVVTSSTGGCPNCSTLSANVTNASCGATYTWNPGNFSGQTVNVCPSNSTTYTVTVNDGCQTTTATVTPPASGTFIWPKHPTGNGREFFTTTAKAPNDDIFAAGFFSKTVAIPGFPSWTALDGDQLMVARFSDTCGTKWAMELGNPSRSETVNDMVVDASGNVFITGSIGAAPTTFGSFTLVGPAMYILKLDGNDGTVLAASASSPSSHAEGGSITIDPGGNVYVSGKYDGSITFPSLASITSTGGSIDVFVVKYDNALVPQWSTGFGSTAHDYTGGIAYVPGTLYVAGNMNDSFPGFTNTTPYTTDMFIGLFNPANGLPLPGGRMEGNATDSCTVRDIAVDSAGNVYFTGSFKGTFNVGAVLTATNTNIFIGRWTPTLGNSWAYSMGGSGIDEGRSISFDSTGNVYFAGNYSGVASFPSFTPSTLPVGNNMFTVKVSLTGTRSFAASSNTTGTSPNALNYSITTLSNGRSYLAGTFTGNITFGSSPLQSSAQWDAIIARLSNTGSFY